MKLREMGLLIALWIVAIFIILTLLLAGIRFTLWAWGLA